MRDQWSWYMMYMIIQCVMNDLCVFVCGWLQCIVMHCDTNNFLYCVCVCRYYFLNRRMHLLAVARYTTVCNNYFFIDRIVCTHCAIIWFFALPCAVVFIIIFVSYAVTLLSHCLHSSNCIRIRHWHYLFRFASVTWSCRVKVCVVPIGCVRASMVTHDDDDLACHVTLTMC